MEWRIAGAAVAAVASEGWLKENRRLAHAKCDILPCARAGRAGVARQPSHDDARARLSRGGLGTILRTLPAPLVRLSALRMHTFSTPSRASPASRPVGGPRAR